jgi:hypothetical protein
MKIAARENFLYSRHRVSADKSKRRKENLLLGKFVSCILCFYYGIFNDSFMAPLFSDNSINKQNTTRIDSILMEIKVFFVACTEMFSTG